METAAKPDPDMAISAIDALGTLSAHRYSLAMEYQGLLQQRDNKQEMVNNLPEEATFRKECEAVITDIAPRMAGLKRAAGKIDERFPVAEANVAPALAVAILSVQSQVPIHQQLPDHMLTRLRRIAEA